MEAHAESALKGSVRLGNYLRRLRAGYGYSLRRVEERAKAEGGEIDNSQLSRYEKGICYPSFDKLRVLASVFNVSVQAFSDVVDRQRWESYPCRVEANTQRLLDLLDETGVKGTFFILGWVADRYPKLVRDIVARGHEPACHSYWHRLIYKLDREEFAADTRRAKDVIEQAAGEAVFGYRAPSYSITMKSLWALEVLAEAGFTYDSSIFPIRHDVYGIPDAPRQPFLVTTPAGPIVEFPITFRDRRVGQSKMSRRIVVEALVVVVQLRAEELLGRARRRRRS